MVNISIPYTLDIESTEVALELDLSVTRGIDEWIVLEFNAYYINEKARGYQKYEKVPYWLHKVIKKQNDFYELHYQDLIQEAIEKDYK